MLLYAFFVALVLQVPQRPRKLSQEEERQLPVQERLYRSSKLWAFYADLEESLGTLESASAVYDAMLELRVATPQIILNYALMLQVRRPFRAQMQKHPCPAIRLWSTGRQIVMVSVNTSSSCHCRTCRLCSSFKHMHLDGTAIASTAGANHWEGGALHSVAVWSCLVSAELCAMPTAACLCLALAITGMMSLHPCVASEYLLSCVQRHLRPV
jgi:hypothetical protein